MACKKPKGRCISGEVFEVVEKLINIAKQNTYTADRKQFNWCTRDARKKLKAFFHPVICIK